MVLSRISLSRSRCSSALAVLEENAAAAMTCTTCRHRPVSSNLKKHHNWAGDSTHIRHKLSKRSSRWLLALKIVLSAGSYYDRWLSACAQHERASPCSGRQHEVSHCHPCQLAGPETAALH